MSIDPTTRVQLTPGDRQLVDRIYDQHAGRLVSIVLYRLWRGRVGAETVVQSVLLSFAGQLARPGAGRPADAELWDLLVVIAIRHCEKHNMRKRRSREVPFGRLGTDAPDGSDGPGFDPPQAGLDLRAVVEADDWVDHVVARLDPSEREVFGLKLSGHTVADIARTARTTQANVQATLRRVRRVVRRCLDEEVK